MFDWRQSRTFSWGQQTKDVFRCELNVTQMVMVRLLTAQMETMLFLSEVCR
jgi:hypothetical protein